MAFTVYAQADLVTARLTLEPRSSAGALETTVLEAIAAGANTQRSLCDILGLAPTLVLQVLGDLWRSGRITINLGSEHETLELTTSGHSALHGDDTISGQAKTTATTSTTEDLIVERLTGRALPVKASHTRVPYEDRDLIVPALPDDRQPSDVSSSELVSALAATLQRDSGEDDLLGDQRVTAAFLQPDLLRVAARRRYVGLRAAAQVSDTGEITISVLDDKLTLSERALATTRLQSVLDEQPTSNFTNRVRTRASHTPLEPHGVEQSVAELNRAIAAVASAAPNQRQQRHDRAFDALNRIGAYALTLTSREMEVRLVHSSEDHATVVHELFKSAEHQIVLAVPWIRQKGLEPFGSALRSALDRGLQVVLLWGIDGHEEGLGKDEADWLDSITAYVNNHGAPGKFLYSRKRAARSHAKLVIADDRHMLVTSKNFLSRSNHFEAGVLLSAIDNRPSPAINAALRYVYDKAPEPRLAYGLHRLPGAFGPRDEPTELELTSPRLTQSLLKETASEASVHAWATAWHDAAARTLRLLDRPHPVIDTLADLRHRGVLRRALSEPKTRILLTSDKVTDTALTEDIADQVARRVEGGSSVHIRYREAAGTGNRGLDKLVDLAQTTDLDLQKSPRMHAKLVLHDDAVLVGSFNPLSVDADLRHSRAAGEFGVEIQSATVANSIWTLFGGPAEVLSNIKIVTAGPQLLADSDLAQDLLESLESPDADKLKATVAVHGLPRLLSVLTDVDLDTSDVLRVGGAALATAATDHEQAAAAEALLRPSIASGNWGVARTMRSLLAEDILPRQRFLDALHEGAQTADSLVTATTSDTPPDPQEAEALTIVDCVALLLQNAPYSDGDPVTTMATVQPAARSTGFVNAAIAHSRSFGQLPPISPQQMGAGGADLPTLWVAAQAALASFQHYDSQSIVGEAFLAALFGPDGELTRLSNLLKDRDQQPVLAWHATASKPTDAKWLDKATQRAGVGRIIDSRRRTFLNLRRKLREEVGHLCSALQQQQGQPVAEPLPTEQLDLIAQLIHETEALHREASLGGSTADAVIAAETQRLLAWNAGTAADEPVRDWHDWPFVTTFHAVADHPGAIDPPLPAIGTDLARTPDPEAAVKQLAAIGEFHRTGVLTAQLSLHDDVIKELELHVARKRAEVQAMLDEQLQSLSLVCQRAGLKFDASTNTIEVTGRQPEAEARLAVLTNDLEARIEHRKAAVAELYESHRGNIRSPEWAEYVASLISDGELELAATALHQPDGVQHTRTPGPFLSWGWRDVSVAKVAGWLSNTQPGPFGVDEFRPAADDGAGQSIVRALVAIAEENPDAPAMWVDAVQQLVHSDDDYPRAQPEVVDGITTTFFQLPYDAERLPRLVWVGEDPIRVSVGAEPSPDCSIRFSLDVSADDAADVTIDIADVLSLLARPQQTTTPTAADRALQFTAMVCSRLDLDEVIDPRDMPTGTTEWARRRLAWLLTILGLTADGRDIDRLIVWSGGHTGVMWTLVKAARHDPVSGISSLAGLMLDEVMIEGVEIDLDRDDDLLVLALGQASLLLVEGCDEAQLAALLEDEWRRTNRPIDHRIQIDEVVERLQQKRYVTLTKDRRIRSCVCRAVLAVEQQATQQWFDDQMDLLDPVTRMRAHEYKFVLEMVKHQEQAEQDLRHEELQRETSDLMQKRLADTSPFDLVGLCAGVLRNYRLKTVDILPELHPEPVEIANVGPSLWVECLVSELLNNAVSATTGLAEGEPTVWLTAGPDPQYPGYALLEVRNNGLPMPDDVREAFLAGRRLRRPRKENETPIPRRDRGLGLYVFRTYGELHGVTYSVSEDTSGMTVVTCRIPRGTAGTSLQEPATE